MEAILSSIFGTSIPAALGLFAFASLITVLAAMRLAKYGDAIADTTGLGHNLVGIILLSAATSLPELFSSSSASFIGNVNLSFGNVFGSNMTNIFILVIMDFYVKNKPILYEADQTNVMTGGVVISFTCITLIMIYVGNLPTLASYDFWYFSVILFIIYLGGMVIIFQYEKRHLLETEKKEEKTPSMSKNQAILGFVVSSMFVFLAAIILSYSCDQISQVKISGEELGGTFVGTVFMAFTTSLPEIIVSIEAVRLGSANMALGNLFGSNLFNLAILSFSDGFYRLGQIVRAEPITKDAFAISDTNHLITGMIGIVFIGIVLSSLMLRAKTKRGPLGLDTLFIGFLYFISLYLLYILR